MYTFKDLVEITAKLRQKTAVPGTGNRPLKAAKIYAGRGRGSSSAVDKNDMENLCEELGDVLFQVMLNSQIAKEKGLFSVEDVIDGICQKMVRRHPWVFGGEKINSTEEGEALWARIKMQEKAKKP